MTRRGESIWKRKDGRWEARYIKSRNDEGKAVYSSVYARSYHEVRKKRTDAIAALCQEEKKKNVENNKMTIHAISEEFLLTHKVDIKESSLSRYRNLLAWYVYPRLGRKLISSLRNDDLDSLSTELITCGNKSGSGLSPKTVKDTMSLVNQIIKFAEKKGYLASSAFSVEYPRQISHSIIIMTPTDQKILESFIIANPNPTTVGILVALYTGIRIGELCGLMWSDFNLNEKTVSVSKTVLRITADSLVDTKTKLIISTPKSEYSKRTIPLHSEIIPHLERMQQLYNYRGEEFFLSKNNRPTEPRNYYLKYQRILADLGLKKYTFHALRHTFATRCIEKGVDPKTLSEILGHANVQITLNRYVHPSFRAKQIAIERLSFGNSGQI